MFNTAVCVLRRVVQILKGGFVFWKNESSLSKRKHIQGSHNQKCNEFYPNLTGLRSSKIIFYSEAKPI